MKRRGMWCVLAMLLWLGSGSAAAEETAQTTPGAAPAAPAGDVRRADPVVVTATRSEQPLEEVGASVTVVPEEAMRVQEYRAVERGSPDDPGRPGPVIGQPREALDHSHPRSQPDPGAGADRRRESEERHLR